LRNQPRLRGCSSTSKIGRLRPHQQHCDATQKTERPLEPVLQPLQQHKDILWLLALDTWIHLPIHGKVEHVPNPIVGVPIDSGSEPVRVVVKGWHEPRRKRCQLICAWFLRLYLVVPETEFPSSPSVRSSRSLRT